MKTLVNLEKGFLEYVLGAGAVTHLADEKTGQFGLVSPDEHSHSGRVAIAVGLDEFFIGPLVHPLCYHGL